MADKMWRTKSLNYAIRRRMALTILCLILFFGCVTAQAGDYTLWVIDTNEINCAPPIASREDNRWNPIRTPDEVIEDLRRYFSGRKIEISILRAAFTNGHIGYCSKVTRRKNVDSLIDILTWPDISRVEHLYDFIQLQGSKYALMGIDQKISASHNDDKIQKRLKKAKSKIETALRGLGIL